MHSHGKTFSRTTIAYVAISLFLIIPMIPSANAKGRFVLPTCPLVKADDQEHKILPSVNLNSDQPQSKQIPSTLEQAQKANLMPLAINQSEAESDKKQKLQFDAAKQQLAELWQATIEQSEDIKMAVSLMQPNSNKKHTAAQAARMLSGLLFSAGSMVLPAIGNTNIPGQLMMGTADGLVSRMIGVPKDDKAPVTAEQSTLIYLLVRSYSNKLQDDFQQYRLAITEHDCAQKTVSDTRQVMEADPSLRSDPMTGMRWVHALDAEELARNKVEIFRQRLIGIAGQDAVHKLDKRIEEEKLALIELIGKPDENIPLIPGQSAELNQEKNQKIPN